MQALLEIKNLSVLAGEQRLLDGLNLRVGRGERVAVLGPSGAGKSTLALSILNLLPAMLRVQGEINFAGRAVLSLSSEELRELRGRGIGLLFEHPWTSLDPFSSIGRQLLHVIRTHYNLGHNLGRAQAKDKAVALLRQVELAPSLLTAYPYELSGGMQQRVALALALAGAPQLLIVDEPTSALDPHTQQQILALILRFQQASGAALLVITHDLEVAESLCQRAVILDQGKIVEDGSLPRLLQTPEHSITRRLVADWRLDGMIPQASKQQSGDTPLLAVERLSCNFQRGWIRKTKLVALAEISFSLSAGEVLAVTGPSGSGKSTLARCLARLLPATTGSVTFCGQDIQRLPRAVLRSQMQLLFQDASGTLNPRRRVLDLLIEPLRIHGLLSTPTEEEAQRLLDFLQLPSTLLYRKPWELSGGQRQRICLGRALVLKPRLLIADEPAASLDPSARLYLYQLLQRWQRQEGGTLLIITHDIQAVPRLANRHIALA